MRRAGIVNPGRSSVRTPSEYLSGRTARRYMLVSRSSGMGIYGRIGTVDIDMPVR